MLRVDVSAARFWHYFEYLLYWLLSDAFFPIFHLTFADSSREGGASVAEVCPFPL